MSADWVSVSEIVRYINAHYTFGQPGWTLAATYEPRTDSGRLFLEAKVRNTYEPDNPALNVVQHTYPIPTRGFPLDYLDQYVRDCIHRAVTHEADEWFRKDGVMIFDPHAPAQAW